MMNRNQANIINMSVFSTEQCQSAVEWLT